MWHLGAGFGVRGGRCVRVARGLAIALFTLTIAACADDEPSAVSSPSSTPTVTSTPAIAPGFCDTWSAQCDFSRQVFDLASRGDLAGLTAFWDPVRVTCPGPAESGKPSGSPACDEQPAGTEIEGYRTGNESVGYVYSRERLGEWVAFLPVSATYRDSRGDGSLQLLSVGCAERETGVPGCSEQFVIILTSAPAIGDGNARVLHAYDVAVGGDGAFRIQGLTAIGGGLGVEEAYAGGRASGVIQQMLDIDFIERIP